jgi:DnaA family protein
MLSTIPSGDNYLILLRVKLGSLLLFINAMRQLLLNLAPQPLQTLKGFVPGRNAELIAVLSDLVKNPPRGERFIYLWGESGAGKTHLLKAISPDGVLIESSANSRLNIELSSEKVLAVDNVNFLGPEGVIDLFNIYNGIRDGDGILVVSGNCPAAQLNLRADLVTRLAWGLAFQVHALTDEEKLMALSVHAKERGFDLKAEVGKYLLTHWRRDMPSLFNALETLDQYSLETKRPITIPLLRQAISNVNDNRSLS